MNLPQAKRRPRRESRPQISGARLSSGAVLWLGREILFIAGGIWGISRRFWLSVELFFEGLTRIIVVVR